MDRDYMRYYFGIFLIHFGIFYGRCQGESEVVVIEEGGSLLWTCDVSPNRTSVTAADRPFSWKRNNRWVNKTLVDPAEWTLHIPAVSSAQHEGVFKCCQKRSTLCGEKKELLVAKSCEVIVEPLEVVIWEGSSHTGQCRAFCASVKEAVLTWQKDGQTVEGQTLENGALTLPRVALGDGGVYRCCATNSVGTFCSKGASLIVVSRLPLLTIQPQSRVAAGSAARFQCLPSSGPPQHEANYDWLFNGVTFPLANVTADSKRVTMLPQGIVHITGLLPSDAGLYQCVDRGSPGSGSHAGNATLEVTEAPSARRWLILVGPVSQDRKIGEAALMECLPQGTDLTVTWTRQDGREIRSHGVRFLGGSNLYFERLTPADSGDYMCNVTDPTTGKSEHASATLRVIAPPVINPPLPGVQKDKLGHVFKILCNSSSAGASLRYSWLFNGVPVVPDRRHVILPGTLRVLYSTSADAGVYQCIVNNGGGEDIAATEIRFAAGAPNAPTGVSIRDVTSTSFKVFWTKPRNVLAWTVRYYPTPDGEEESMVTTFDYVELTKGITPFTEYNVVVVAVNKVSGSDPSETLQLTTAPGKPLDSPVFFLANTPHQGVQVSCLPLLREVRQGLVTKYLVEYKMAVSQQILNHQIWGNGSGSIVTGLQEGHTYSFRVAAVTVIGSGPYSAWKDIVVQRTDELSKPIPQVEIWNGTSVSVLWDQALGNSTIDGYRLVVTNMYHEPIGDIRTVPASISTAILGDLEPKADYEIHIAAYNVYGDGPRSVLNFSTPSDEDLTPEPVCPVQAPYRVSSSFVTSTSLVISWSQPITNIPYDNFMIQYKQTQLPQTETQEVITNDNLAHGLLVTGLQPYTSYSFRVSVGCKGGFGQFGQTYLVVTSQDVPATPPESVIANPLDQHTVDVKWQPPLKPNGVIIYYMVLYNKDNVTPEHQWRSHQSNGTSQQSIIDNLDSGTRYFFKVKAATLIGDGPSTDPVPALTKPDKSPRMSQKQLGVLIGVCLALVCIVLCCILIMSKYKSVDPHSSGRVVYHPGGVPHQTRPYAHPQEHDSTMMPMLAQCGHVRTTFRNSGHYLTHYPDSTLSQESSRSSTCAHGPQPGDTSSPEPAHRTTSHSHSTLPPPGDHSTRNLHLDTSGFESDPHRADHPGETSCMLPSVYSPSHSPHAWNGRRHPTKETVV